MLKKKYLLREYITNEERVSDLIKVTYKSILGAAREPDYTYNRRYSARHPYF